MLKPGEMVGPYEIRGFVGQGGMGQVYRAFDPRLERTVALKVIRLPEHVVDSPLRADVAASAGGGAGSGPSGNALVGESSARLLREARAVASLSHPNVVAIFDVGEANGRLYLAMEYVVGSSLRALVGNVELPLARRVRWLVDVARALEAAHRAGIIHRDVKPENVMVRDDGAVKVLDFGIARRTTARSATEEQHAIDTVTGRGSIVGTPVYMAPEQIKGGDVDARSDQFAWAVMAYELVTGERPWVETGDVLSVVANILTEPPRPIRPTTKDVPAVVEETIMRGLSKEPGRRFGSMLDVADALEPFAAHATGGDRMRVTARPLAEDDPAYAATTRVPTTVSVRPAPSGAPGPFRAEPRWRAVSLAIPLVLVGALAGAVYAVRTRQEVAVRPKLANASSSSPNASTRRPLSTVAKAETAYEDAMNLWHDGASDKARVGLARAIELDPTFATAHLHLALHDALADDTRSARASFQSAYQYRQMLLPRDERLLEASEPFVRLDPDVEEWETRLTSAVFQYPRDPELHYFLGRSRERQGDDEGAKSAYAAALRLDDGFVPAVAAIATTAMRLGNVAEGLATTERCVERSPVAATCVETRFELLTFAGECTRAKDEAGRWGALEPQSPRPFASLARALLADGAPRPSIEEVLARRWSLLSPDARPGAEVWDRALLAILDGELSRADDLAREYDSGLPHTADSSDHAGPARLRVEVLGELDKPKDAARAAHSFLDRMAAWPSDPFAIDPSFFFYVPLYRAGEITKRELEEKRTEWLERDRQRTSGGLHSRDPWVTWTTLYGDVAENREEAIDALAHAPTGRANRKMTSKSVELARGKVSALAGRWDEAIQRLEPVISSCATFESTIPILQARYFLAEALAGKGDVVAARAVYEKVVETWPKTTTARTVKRAMERLGPAALPRR